LGNTNGDNAHPFSVVQADFSVPGMNRLLVLTLCLVVLTLTTKVTMIVFVRRLQRKNNDFANKRLQTAMAVGGRGPTTGDEGLDREKPLEALETGELLEGLETDELLGGWHLRSEGSSWGLPFGTPPDSFPKVHALGQGTGEFP